MITGNKICLPKNSQIIVDKHAESNPDNGRACQLNRMTKHKWQQLHNCTTGIKKKSKVVELVDFFSDASLTEHRTVHFIKSPKIQAYTTYINIKTVLVFDKLLKGLKDYEISYSQILRDGQYSKSSLNELS